MSEKIDSENHLEDKSEEKEIDDIKEYDLIKDNKIYKIKITKDEDELLFICDQYLIKLKLKDIIRLTKENFYNIIEAYNYFIDIFEKKKVQIKYIKKKKAMRLSYEKDEKESIVISLKYNNSYNLDNRKKTNENTFNLKYLFKITFDSDFNDLDIDLYEIFKSINDITYIVYLNYKQSLVCYDLYHGKYICEIKVKYNERILNIKHLLDTNCKRDLLITNGYSIIRVWDIYNMECIFKLNELRTIKASNFLVIDKNIYIMYSYKDFLYEIKIIDLDGHEIKKINDSEKRPIYYIGSYYDIKLDQNYIISCNKERIKSYNYKDNKLYRIYNHKLYQYKFHYQILTDNKNTRIVTLDKIWDFHSGELLKDFSFYKSHCSYLLHKNFLMFEKINELYIIDTYLGQIVKIIKVMQAGGNIYNIKKMVIPKIGKCFLLFALPRTIVIMKES